jgi:hypothetical protein
MIKRGQNKPPELTRGAGKSRADREASLRAARLEAESESPFWDRREACNFPRSPLNERMRSLLDRLNIAQHAVTGPPPMRVSFSKIAEWCEGVAGASAPEVYRDLLQSYLSGAFEHTLVFYLMSSAPDLSGESGLTGYRMRRTFLADRARNFSLDDANEAGALFEAYLAPCWIHRAAAVRLLEAKGYPVPPLWKQARSSEGPTELPSTEQPERKLNKSGRKPKYPPERIRDFVFDQMNHNGEFYLGDPNWRAEADLVRALTEEFELADSTAKDLIKGPLAEWRDRWTKRRRCVIGRRPSANAFFMPIG